MCRSTDENGTSSSTTAAKAANPFANFSALTQKAPSSGTLANSNFGALKTPLSMTSSSVGLLTANDSSLTQKVSSSNTQLPVTTLNAFPQNTTTSDSQVPSNPKIRKLNQRFLDWVNRQMETNPTSIWIDGVQVWKITDLILSI